MQCPPSRLRCPLWGWSCWLYSCRMIWVLLEPGCSSHHLRASAPSPYTSHQAVSLTRYLLWIYQTRYNAHYNRVTHYKNKIWAVLTDAVLYFGHEPTGWSDVWLVGEVTRVKHVIYSRPMLTVVQKLIMLRVLREIKLHLEAFISLDRLNLDN